MPDLHLLSPAGFRAAGVYAGIKTRNLPDVALLLCDRAATAAAVFTTNKVIAAPVKIGRAHVKSGRLRGVVVNAGNANACTGKQGEKDALRMCSVAAGVAHCKTGEILPSSTGIIGHLLPMRKLERGIVEAGQYLGDSREHALLFADAILTTDTRRKHAATQLKIGREKITLAGVCKGSGMIGPRMSLAGAGDGSRAGEGSRSHIGLRSGARSRASDGSRSLPASRSAAGAGAGAGSNESSRSKSRSRAKARHATMLAYLTTDARISAPALRALLSSAADGSFNAVTVDDHTSTNDTACILASGASGGSIRTARELRAFGDALDEVCTSLAHQIAADGEGATKVVAVTVRRARSDAAARAMARAIANSPLVKCAMHGNDPNWGRIVSAAGLAGVPFDPDRCTLTLQGTPVFRAGRPLSFDAPATSAALAAPEVKVILDCRSGSGSATVWTCDLSKEYVAINADYHT